MNRFLLFAFERYEEAGGWDDFEGSYKSLHSAKKAAIMLREGEGWLDCFQIVDLKTETLQVWRGQGPWKKELI